MRIKPTAMSLKQKELHYERVAEFLKWLREHNNILLTKYADNGDMVRSLTHKEIEHLMSQYCGLKLFILTPMSEEE